ncbi:hypothetical protein [Hydrogenophaga sp. 5NK40-0174]|uniref:adenylate/guanylate cyclase domain-containing protein n=1 Tax=Hydrogenophaga sp. 5NK40-0174 TaxID=3127649 RepID=UPI003102E5CB
MTFVTRDGQTHSNPVTADAMQEKVVLVMDLVESVRLMAGDEAGTVERWRSFLHHARDEVLPPLQGRMVKSLGDGFLAEFDSASEAVKAALTLHEYFPPLNKKLDASSRMYLRAGLNATHLYVDEQDVFGHGVNLAARVTTLAAPGETVVTANVRDAIVDGLDGETEDMGESYLKHWPEPVRTWRVWSASKAKLEPAARRPMPPPQQDLRPTIAVIPFTASASLSEHKVVGELVADGVIARLSKSQQLKVISRLTTTALRGRSVESSALQERLNAQYALSGSYAVISNKVVLTAELTDVRAGEVIWSERMAGSIDDLLQADSDLINSLTNASAQAVLSTTLQRSLILPVPQLDSNALLLGGIALMHRSTERDLDRSKELLDAVVERHQRVATPWAWLAKWHILQVMQGRTQDPASEFRKAIDIADRSMDLDPGCSLAIAVKGHALCHLGKEVDEARHLLDLATQANPNEPMAWLYSGLWSSMWGAPKDAIQQVTTALSLSPLDPQRYYFEMMLANSYGALKDWNTTATLCRESLRRNRYHLPTIRTQMIAEFERGELDEAKRLFGLVQTLQPGLTLSKYMAVGGNSSLKQIGSRVFKALGLPD